MWTFRLHRPLTDLNSLAEILSPDDRTRVARYRFAHLRDEATVSRGMLRRIVGAYLGVRPTSLSFHYNPQGKPCVPGAPIQFNLSHSGSWGICAVTRDGPVGVDIELIRADLDLKALAQQYFSPNEQRFLATYPAGCAVQGFFRCWTSKEAYIKGRGGGLSIPLDEFDVPLGPERAGQPVVSRDGWSDDGDGWYIRELRIDTDLAGAVALRRRNFDVRGFEC